MANEGRKLESLMEKSRGRSTGFTKTIMPKSMTADEVIRLINEKPGAIVATVRKDGSPHTAWNALAYVDDRLYTYAHPHSVCYRNLKRDRRVSAAVISGDKAVFMDGEANEVGQVSKLFDTLLARILSVAKNWMPERGYNYTSLRECQGSIFEVTITRILSWKP